MANLYLVDKPAAEYALPLAAADADARVVLVQDGVYLASEVAASAEVKVYAVAPDIERRGLRSRLPASVQVIDYGELVDLIVEHKVVNFA